jgi:hypothetical protein
VGDHVGGGTRRDLLKKAAVAGTVAWVAPAVVSVSAATAESAPRGPQGPCAFVVGNVCSPFGDVETFTIENVCEFPVLMLTPQSLDELTAGQQMTVELSVGQSREFRVVPIIDGEPAHEAIQVLPLTHTCPVTPKANGTGNVTGATLGFSSRRLTRLAVLGLLSTPEIAVRKRRTPGRSRTMSTISTLTDVQDKVLDTVTSTQEPIVNFVKKVVELAESRVPELKLSINDNLPQAHELVELQFAFADKVLKNQHAFVNEILDAVKPVTDKVVETKAAPAKPKAAKAA